MPRFNLLSRPKAANITLALIFFAAKNPLPDFLLLDKMLIMCLFHKINPVICFNKWDLLSDTEKEELLKTLSVYRDCGFPLFVFSTFKLGEAESLMLHLKNQTVVLAGPSGVGKSSFLNALFPALCLPTGNISERLRRGKHTTRCTEMLLMDANALIADTPGFSLLDLPPQIAYNSLASFYPEYGKLPSCRFDSCVHHKEPGCSVKEALKEGALNINRYNRYLYLLEELQKKGINLC
jgi:ribosome biogenesis GTPase